MDMHPIHEVDSLIILIFALVFSFLIQKSGTEVGLIFKTGPIEIGCQPLERLFLLVYILFKGGNIMECLCWLTSVAG